MTAEVNVVESHEEKATKVGRLSGITYWTVLTLGALGLLMAINQTFTLRAFGFMPLGNSFLYYLIGIFLAAAFLIYPMTCRQAQNALV